MSPIGSDAQTPSPLVDERAAMLAAALVTPRSRPSLGQVAALRAAVVADLEAVDRAAREQTRLGADLPPARIEVLGRAGWVRANLAAVRGLFEPLRDRIGDRPGVALVLGTQLGTVFGLLSTKVLGQYVLPLAGDGPGRLVVVGPNLLALEARHGNQAVELRRAILLHEITHRLQFAAAPWLAGHLRELIERYVADARIRPEALREASEHLSEIVAQVRASGTLRPLIERVMTDTQRQVLDEAQAVMTLLEGHGNATMYGAALLEDPEAVREILAHRRRDVTTWILTVVLGIESKRRQYRDGERFVRSVIDEGGVERLNRAFVGPDFLPTLDEVAEPHDWLARTG